MINSKKSVIEINGKQYDARTGRVLGGDVTPASTKTIKNTPSKSMPKTVTDISRASSSAINRTRRTADKSRTLMRQAVRKPDRKPTIKTASAPSIHGKQKQVLSPNNKIKLTAQQDIDRQARSQSVKQSQLVSKFQRNKPTAEATKPVVSNHKIANLPVKPAPIAKPTRNTTQPSRVDSILENGLKNAQSHNQVFEHNTHTKTSIGKKGILKRKIVSYGAGIAAVFLLGGFYAYQNIPNISMRYANARSGINASLPSYKPSGFSMSNKIQYNPGQVTVSFASNSDERNFSITQRESTWNSESLLNSYVSSKTDQIQRYEDKGRTIYLYGENNATWVNGGVWYDINGDSKLNSDQLIRIASSM